MAMCTCQQGMWLAVRHLAQRGVLIGQDSQKGIENLEVEPHATSRSQAGKLFKPVNYVGGK